VIGELPARTSVASFIRIKGSWRSLGTATTSRSGALSIPAIKMTKAGNHPIRLTTKKGKSFFLQLAAQKR
jgi:hypothetical protein